MASWVGTTGAAMLMIRPVIKANAWREKKAHIIIFFIFMVANIGGCLTPVGDPPLFLGFLTGIPFFCTMRLFPIMMFNVIILLVVFTLLDKHLYKKEIAAGRMPALTVCDEGKDPLRIEGSHNFIFIIMIVAAVIISGLLPDFKFFADQVTGELHGVHLAGVVFPFSSIVEITIILIAAMLSMVTTRKATRDCNSFSFAPIEEVAKLFIGIFLTMIPALAILKANGASLGLSEPWHFFWATGVLSSFLDNAPTYLVFLTTAGSIGFTEGISTSLGIVGVKVLMAISAGAVFMGANTYIGNAPNFMVKSIAEENNIKMPSFFGYMVWSLCILVPVFILDTLIFFI
jgi:Na+/H+ antiporter NhaD/arsenite permease-like protein